MIQIGAILTGWSNDTMLELKESMSAGHYLSEVRHIGFAGIELGNTFSHNSSEVTQALKDHQLQLISSWHSTELLTRDVDAELIAVEAHASWLRDMGCNVLIVSETSNAIHQDIAKPLSQRPVLPSDVWGRFGMRLTQFSLRIKQTYGLQLVYHHHMGSIVQTEAEIDRLMMSTGDAVHLLLDTAHITWGGGDPIRVAKNYKTRISHVHCKDINETIMQKANAEDWSFIKSSLAGICITPGAGCIDYAKIFAEIPSYSGWLVMETMQLPENMSMLENVSRGFSYLSNIVTTAGLELSVTKSTNV